MLADARVGTSGFAYREWIGPVYPAEAAPHQLLPMYAERLQGVELPSLPPEMAEEWASSVPPGFQFAVRAPNRVAAELFSGKGGVRAMGAFLETAVRLGNALGPVLLQVPESRRADRGALRAFLEQLPRGLRVAFEFRHHSWREDATLRLLSQHDAALVLNDDGQGPPPLQLTSGFTYVRIRSDGDGDAAIDAWAERLGSLARRGIDVYAFVKQDRRGLAVDHAMRLATLLRAESDFGEQAILS
jgi:uncharacterized protein YecE (DUF72 family)